MVLRFICTLERTVNIYHPPMKLRVGNVSTGVCLSTEGGGVGISGPMCFPGDRYLWSQVLGGGGGRRG